MAHWGDPVIYLTERRGHQIRTAAERLDCFPVGPSSVTLERLRQIPVVERRPWFDAAIYQASHEPLLELDTSAVDVADAFGQDPGPCNREAVRGHAQ